MRAMILAAGRGERMRPLTDHTPKPLLRVAGKPLIEWHLERLAQAGIRDVVINHAWLGEQLEAALGRGERWNLRIHWSPEPPGGLETAGGIARALPLLGREPFLVINGDVWCDWQPQQALQLKLEPQQHAWLLLVANPAHHPGGDFWLFDHQVLHQPPERNAQHAELAPHPPSRLTFAGVGIYRPELFAHLPSDAHAPLAPILRQAMANNTVIGSRHHGEWVDVGTPERLQQLDARLRNERP